MRGTLALSWGPWGGFYVAWNGRNAITRRLCLGWVAITWIGIELDDLMEAYAGCLNAEIKADLDYGRGS